MKVMFDEWSFKLRDKIFELSKYHKFFGQPVVQTLMRYFVEHPEKRVDLLELHLETKVSPSSSYRRLKDLTRIGAILIRKRGKEQEYWINKKYLPYYAQLFKNLEAINQLSKQEEDKHE